MTKKAGDLPRSAGLRPLALLRETPLVIAMKKRRLKR